MTSPAGRASAAEQFGDAMLEKRDVLDKLRAELPPPLALRSLIDDIAPLGLREGSIALDVGAGYGNWSKLLRERYRCECIALDLSSSRLRRALEDGTPSVVADVDVLPFQSESVHAIWCRDMLEMVEDPAVTLTELHPVLRRGGAMMLYVPFMTEAMEPRERAELVRLSSTSWWGEGRAPIDDAIARAGFEVVSFKITSPQFSENALLNEPQTVVDQLLEHAQLRRGQHVMEPAVGAEWYARFLAWTRWQAYLILGKLENGLWLLRKPAWVPVTRPVTPRPRRPR